MDEDTVVGASTEIRVLRSGDGRGWTALVNPPGSVGSGGAEREVFSCDAGTFTTGFWERAPDTWSFERPYDEVSLILSGVADIETSDGQMLHVEAGDVLVTPKGSKGTWHIRETLVKFYAIYGAG